MAKVRHQLFCFVCSFLVGMSVLAQQHDAKPEGFNAAEANRKFDEISIKLSTQNLKLEELEVAVQQLEQLQTEAEQCTREAKVQLETINELLTATDEEISENDKSKNYQYLEDKKNFYAAESAECRLFTFRAEEALTAFKETIQTLSASKKLRRSLSLWRAIEEIDKVTFAMDKNILFKKSGLTNFTWEKIGVLTVFVVVALILASYFRYMLRRGESLVVLNKPKLSFFLKNLREFCFPLLLALGLFLFFQVAINGKEATSLQQCSEVLLLYVMALFIAKLMFAIKSKEQSFLMLPVALSRAFYRKIVVIASLGVVGYLLVIFLRDQPLTEQTIAMIRIAYSSIFSTALIWMLWRIGDFPLFEKHQAWINVITKIILLLTLISLLGMEWLGYHQLDIFVVSSVFLSLSLAAGVCILIFAGDAILNLFVFKKTVWSQKVRAWLGVKTSKPIFEIALLRFCFYVVCTVLFALSFLSIWHVSLLFVEKLENFFIEGFKLADFIVSPLKIILSLVAFALVLITGRAFAAHAAKQHQFAKAKDSQVAVASIINYVAFSLALLLALLIAGVNFTGLAIIAGALSVGIGFGLQNVANNFISGVILLLQKPIKPGDRVIVEQTEGYVQKIRILNTQITTLAKEDVIVPNAMLTSNPITNYMFKNQLWRVVCKVGVAYGSDTVLVRQVLLEVASQHPEILQDPENQPSVLFRGFGESSLDFELWGIIHDVNKKFQIISDLNFAIDKTFRQHHIVIAFPQRDLHVKEWPNKPAQDDSNA